MSIKPIAVKALENYRIWLKFDDGTEGEADLSHLKGKGVFTFWDTENNFEKVYIDEESSAIAWSDIIELDSLNLYLKLTGKSFEEWRNEHVEHASN